MCIDGFQYNERVSLRKGKIGAGNGLTEEKILSSY
jgi:hypothetical protein